eukprot:jgi/Chlat1/6203/Chrsp44S05800
MDKLKEQEAELDSDEEDDQDYNPGADEEAQRAEQNGTSKLKPPQRSSRRGALVQSEADTAQDVAQLKAATTENTTVQDPQAAARKSKVEAIWAQLNKAPVRTSVTPAKQEQQHKPGFKSEPWLANLGKVARSSAEKSTDSAGTSGSSTALAAAALAAAKAAVASVPDTSNKLAVTETRDFAGETVRVTRLLDPNTKEAAAAAKRKTDQEGSFAAHSDSALDSLLQKMNVLDKTRMDWGTLKDKEGTSQELEEHKKSGDKYTEKVAFLQRSELREYEAERDLKLAAINRRPRP